MSMTAGPHAPKQGWQTRWAKQAASLLMQSPLTIIIGFCGILACALINNILMQLLPGLAGYIPAASITAAMGGLVPIAICASLGISEKYGIANQSQVISAIKTFVIAVFTINSILVTIAIIILLSGTKPEIPPESKTQAEIFLYGGIRAISAALFTNLPINALWVVLATQMPTPLNQLRISNFHMMQKCFQPWLAIMLVIMLVAQLNLFIPPLAAMAALIFLSAWLYVAGREIFGGISSNKYSIKIPIAAKTTRQA